MSIHRRKATGTRKAQPEFELRLMNPGVSGKIITSREGVTSTRSALTKSTVEVSIMAKKSLPNLSISTKPGGVARIDLTGKRFGRLVVQSYYGRKPVGATPNGKPRYANYWNTVCDCGQETVAETSHLRCGHTMSCGCLRRDRTKQANTKHGRAKSDEYRCWQRMLDRCRNPNNPRFEYYGGRGIKVCDRWSEFQAFFADMGKRPSGKHSLERVDVNGNYEPKNCVWATHKEQMNNVRTNHLITWQGRTQTISEWADELGFRYGVLAARLTAYKWTVERAFTEPLTIPQYTRPDLVKVVLAELATGKTQVQVAKKLGTSQSIVSKIKRTNA